MVLALEMGASKLKAKSDSQLVSNQVVGEHQEKEPQLVKYLHKVRSLSSHFKSFEVKYVSNKQNFRADLLSKLSTTKTARCNRTVLQETLVAPNIKADKIYTLQVSPDLSWRCLIPCYMQKDELPKDEEEAKKVRKQASMYTLLTVKLYKLGRASAMLWCRRGHETS